MMDAQTLHQQGREAGEQGDLALALQFFQKAHEADPAWPYPLYDIAFTYLLQEDSEKAYAYYKKVDELAPKGFFTVKTAIWTLEREQSGEYAKGLYTAYTKLEWVPENERLSVLQKMLEHYPSFTPAYKSMINLFNDPDKRLALINKGLEQDADDETYCTLVVHKALILKYGGNPEAADVLLNELLNSPRCTAAGKAMVNMAMGN